MKNPKIRTQVVHSKTQSAWNVVATYPAGCKYKIARVPYFSLADDKITSMNREEAFKHAQYISYCFNNSDQICNPNHVNTSTMSNFKTRLLEEKAQLDERIENLKAFRNSENFQNISHSTAACYTGCRCWSTPQKRANLVYCPPSEQTNGDYPTATATTTGKDYRRRAATA